MSEIDWSKAPEGATHYEPGYDDHECAWVRVDENGDRHYWFKGMWLNAELTGDEIGPVDSMIPRPTRTNPCRVCGETPCGYYNECPPGKPKADSPTKTDWVDGLPPESIGEFRKSLALNLQNAIEAITGEVFSDDDALILAHDTMCKYNLTEK